MFNKYIDGIAVLAGMGPCATRHEDTIICEEPFYDYPTDGYVNKPVYFYTGMEDSLV